MQLDYPFVWLRPVERSQTPQSPGAALLDSAGGYNGLSAVGDVYPVTGG